MRAIREAALHVSTVDDSVQIRKTAAFRAWLEMLVGDSPAAEMYFLSADRLELANELFSKHLYSLRGAWWGEFLARTGRPGPARTLTDSNRTITTLRGWQEDVARCDRILARLDLMAGNPVAAKQRLVMAATTFRDGHYLVELAATLPILADSARASGDLAAATRHVEETLNIAGPRGRILSQAAALAVRRRDQHDPSRTVADRRIARALTRPLTCGFSTILPSL